MNVKRFLFTGLIAATGLLWWALWVFVGGYSSVPEPPDLGPEPVARILAAPPVPDSRSRALPSRQAVGVAEVPSSEPLSSRSLPSLEDAIPGEYTLRFQSARDREAFEALAARYGIRVLDRLVALHAIRIQTPDAIALRRLLAVAPSPLDLAPNVLLRLFPPETKGPVAQAPDTPYRAFGEDVLSWLGVSSLSQDWGKGVRIAVLDSGIAGYFPGMVSVRMDMTGEGFGEGRHGSAVASLISGDQGVAPGSTLLDFKVLNDDGGGDVFTLARGILQAVDLGADVINICAGTRGNNPLLEQAVAYALERGVAVIAAAGNDGLGSISYPAAYAGVVKVGGVDADGRHLHFSNTGMNLDLSAPGLGIAISSGENGEKLMFSGTSAAAPLVTSAFAFLRSQDPDLKPDEIISLLKKYSNDAGAPGPDSQTGAGILNVGRLLERDTPGIVDMVAMTPFVIRTEGGKTVKVEVSGENRGTEFIPQVEMRIEYDGQQKNLIFYNVGVGDTVAHSLQKEVEILDREGMDITFALRTVGEADSRPGNNSLRFVILPQKR